jgi:hypothetical protein
MRLGLRRPGQRRKEGVLARLVISQNADLGPAWGEIPNSESPTIRSKQDAALHRTRLRASVREAHFRSSERTLVNTAREDRL